MLPAGGTITAEKEGMEHLEQMISCCFLVSLAVL